MKSFVISGSDLIFLNAQVAVPIIEVVRYETTGTPIYGYIDPNNGSTIELGVLGSFNLMGTDWASFLPPVVTNGALTGLSTPATSAEPVGLRNVQGLFNNLSAGTTAPWGAAFASFARNSNAEYAYYLQQIDTNTAFFVQIKPDPKDQALVNVLDGVDPTINRFPNSSTFNSGSEAQLATGYTSTTETLYGLMDAYEKSLVQNSTYGIEVNPTTGAIDLSQRYANPFFTVWDYTPRVISQTVNSYEALLRTEKAAGGGILTDIAIANNEPGATAPTAGSSSLSLYIIQNIDGSVIPGGFDASGNLVEGGQYSKEDFVRNLNTLGGDPSMTGWQTLFGQFFDHGLDLTAKGGNITPSYGPNLSPTGAPGSVAKIRIPLDPSDPLYNEATGQTYLTISRATVKNPEAAGLDGMFGTADDILSPGADGIYGNEDDISGATNPDFENYTSPYIDQSQTYGSNDDVTNLLRQWVLEPMTGKFVPGMFLFDGKELANPWNRTNPDGSTEAVYNTLPTLNELRTELVRTGRADLSWEDINNLRARDANGQVLDLDPSTPGTQAKFTDHILIADMLPRLDAAHILISDPLGRTGADNPLNGLIGISRPGTGSNPNEKYVSDYLDVSSGRATATGMDPNNGSIVTEILLRAIGDHYIAGDGRANENMGLTAIHHVWHENHNWQIKNLIKAIGTQQANDPTKAFAHQFQIDSNNGVDGNGNYIDISGNITWNQELMFQEALFINQMEYQHVAIDQFARLITPNIPLFVSYDTSINSDITVDFSQGAYRFGHSQLREVIDALDPNGSLTAMVTHYSLGSSFLNPEGFKQVGATALAMGMSRQFSSEIDEMITPALQQNLLGQATDLAALNIARGRDVGLPTLNELRRQLSTGMATNLQSLQIKLANDPNDTKLQEAVDKTIALQAGLTPYTSWNDFQAAMIHPDAVANFIAAYSFDGDIETAEFVIGMANKTINLNPDPSDTNAVNALQTKLTKLGWSVNDALGKAFDFMEGGDKGFEAIDAWVGGIAEKHVFLGQLGPTFDAIFTDQMTRLINGDRFYYFWRLQLGLPTFTNLIASVATEQFMDVIERTTGAKHLVGDVFLAADSYVELGENPIEIFGAAYDPSNPTTRSHKYGDLVAEYGLGVASKLGVNENNNGSRITIDEKQYIYDARPDSGVNPDGTARIGFNAHEVIGGTRFDDYIDAGDGDDTLYGDEGDDILKGNAGADHIYGEAGNDKLYGGSLPDFMDGGMGDDWLEGGDDADVLIGSEGNDRLYGLNGADELWGGSGDDYIDGGIDADIIFAGEGQDIVVGGEGLDTAYGEWGDDRMFAGAGPDQLFGGDGDDILNAGTGSGNQNLNVDEALGEGGFNIVSFSDIRVKLDRIADLNFQNVNLGSSTPFGQLWVDIQGIEGTFQDDQIIGDAQDNWLIGGGGTDYIYGGGGDDVIIGDMARLDLLNSLLAPADQHFLGLQASNPNFTFGMNVYVNADNISYTSVIEATNDFVVYAGDLSNFRFEAVLDPTNNTNVIGTRIFDQNLNETGPNGDLVLGIEKAIFSSSFATDNRNATTHNLFNSATAASLNTTQIISFGSLVTTSGCVSRNASAMALPNTLDANLNSFENVLSVSVTSIYGVRDITAVVWQQQAPGNVNNAWTTATNAYSSTYQGSVPFGFTPDSGVTEGTIFRPIVTFRDALGTPLTAIGVPTVAMGRLVLGTTNNEVLTGTAYQDMIYSGEGNDTLDGGAGNDYLVGGLGDDTYIVDSTTDVITELADGGTDTVQASVSYTLGANVENLTLTGTAAINGTGNDLNNVITGNTGNNTLDGGTGIDTLVGGGGDDTYIVDSTTDVINELPNEGTDTIQSSVTYTLGDNLENLILTSSGNINGTGNDLDNTITGNTGNNTLDGGTGKDTVVYSGSYGDPNKIVGVLNGNIVQVSLGDYIMSFATDAKLSTTKTFTLTDTRNTSNTDGTDTISNIEGLKFSNGTLDVLELLSINTSPNNTPPSNTSTTPPTTPDPTVMPTPDPTVIPTPDPTTPPTTPDPTVIPPSNTTTTTPQPVLTGTTSGDINNLVGQIINGNQPGGNSSTSPTPAPDTTNSPAPSTSSGGNGATVQQSNIITNDTNSSTVIPTESNQQVITTTTEQTNVVSSEQTSEFVEYIGTSKRDKWFGTDQNDRADLGKGNDIGFGSDGDDSIDGGDGNDTIEGGRGGDRLTGGKGRDRFVMNSLQDSLLADMDTLVDFKVGTDIFDGPQRISAKNILKINSTINVDFGEEALANALNNTEFKANKAALLSFANGNYLVINDQTDGWDPMQDAIIKINTTKNLNKFAIV